MKIKFLGTSAGWPLPRLGCKCKICTSSDPKDTRTRTQLIINDEILVDAGPDTYGHLLPPGRHSRPDRESDSRFRENDMGVDPTKIKAVLISHEHPDHTMGFWDLTHIYNNNQPIEIIVTLELVSKINNLIGPHRKNLKVKIVKPNESFLLNRVKVEYFPVIHGKTPAFGIKFKESKIFIYITDFNRILPSQEKTVKHADYWAIDGSSLDKIGQGPGHISIKDGIYLSQKFKIKNIYFVHIGHKTDTHEQLENYLKQNAGSNFHTAYDGLEINI